MRRQCTLAPNAQIMPCGVRLDSLPAGSCFLPPGCSCGVCEVLYTGSATVAYRGPGGAYHEAPGYWIVRPVTGA